MKAYTEVERRHKCCHCGNLATWYYMPSGLRYRYYCDDCVPRGCGCNIYDIQTFGLPEEYETVRYYTDEQVKNNDFEHGTDTRIDESSYYEVLDCNNRRMPCCEYTYSPNGFNIDKTTLYISKESALNILKRTFNAFKNNDIEEDMVTKIKELIDKSVENILLPDEFLEYNKFMRNVYDICSIRFYSMCRGFSAINFYNSFKVLCYNSATLDGRVTYL